MMELSLLTVVGYAAIFFMSGIGIGMFVSLFAIKRPTASYTGQVILHGNMTGPTRASPEAPGEGPISVLSATFKNRFDGKATLRFEGDCPARDAIHDSEVGDRWRIDLYRVRKINPKAKREVRWEESEMSKAFGGKAGKAF